MVQSHVVRLPAPSPEQRRVAAGQYERANQVLATGNFDYGIQLLLTCCKLDPGNFIYRQALRQAQKKKYRNNLRGSSLAILTVWPARLKLRAAASSNDPAAVLELAEYVLIRNPWDLPAQVAMADAFTALELVDQAIWTLEQCRQKHDKNLAVIRMLARLYEKPRQLHAGDQVLGDGAPGRPARPRSLQQGQGHRRQRDHRPRRLRSGRDGQPAQPPARKKEAQEEPPTATHALDETASVPPLGNDKLTREVAPHYARIKADPTSANAYLSLAAVYRRAGELDRAREVLHQGLAPDGERHQSGPGVGRRRHRALSPRPGPDGRTAADPRRRRVTPHPRPTQKGSEHPRVGAVQQES